MPDDWWNCKLQTTTKQGKDEKHGPWASWYANNQRQQVGTYEHDVQIGVFTWWHNNGQKALEGRFDFGKQDGVWTWWYPNGQKSIHGEYARGNPIGRWTWWKEDGKVAQSADLSHTGGIVVETPSMVEPDALPHAASPKSREKSTR
jgi:antitoxin component YwqK of YwqJK toxin-antitoxin module